MSITTMPAPDTVLDRLRELEGISSLDGRMVADFPLRADDYLLTARIFSFTDDDAQRFYVREEASGSSELPSVYVEAGFAAANGLAAGREVEIKVGETFERFRIQKVVSTPEALNVVQNAYFWGSNSDFGYVYLPQAHMDTVFGRGDICCQFLFRLSEDVSDEEAESLLEEATELLKPYAVLQSFSPEDSPVRRSIDVNLEPLRALSLLLPPIFFAIMLFVLLLFLLQIIRRSRKNIGILRTFGFGRMQIAGLFHVLCFVITLPAIFLGLPGSILLMRLATRLYADAFWLPPLATSLRLQDCLLAASGTLLIGQVAAAVGCLQLAGIKPIEILQGQVNFSASPQLMNRLPRRLSPLTKLSLAVILRNGKRFLLSAVCITAAMVLIVSAISFDRSKNYILEELFDARIDYDCQIYLPGEPDEARMQELRQVPGVESCEYLDYLLTELTYEGGAETVTIHAPQSEAALLHIFGADGRELSVPSDGILLEKHLAEKLGIHVGEQVLIGEQALTVQALTSQCVSRAHYVSRGTMQSLGADGCSILVSGTDERALRTYLKEYDEAQAVFTRVVRTESERAFQSYSIGVYIIIAFSLAMSLLIVHSRMKSALAEQQHELATLRVLGMYRSEISLSWLAQSLLQYLLSTAVGIPGGAWTARLILREMSTSLREYPFANRPADYLSAAGILLLFVLLGHFLSMRELKKWDLAQAVKTRE